MERLNDFLSTEVIDGLYQEIIMFINHYEIRCGEFEGNRYIIKKLDHDNFIIFLEEVYPDGHKEVSGAMAFCKKQILNIIEEQAKKRGLN